MIIAIALVVAAVAMLVALLERRSGRGTELAFRRHLAAELEGARIRVAQVEHMLDEHRAHELEIAGPADRDTHLVVNAPSMRAPGRPTAAPPILDVELSIDALPPVLRDELRAIEGDDVVREYLETIQRELAAGADATQLAARLFDPEG